MKWAAVEVGGLLVGPALIFGYLFAHGAWAAYRRQLTASSGGDRIMSIGISPYFHFNRWKIIALVLGVSSALGLLRLEKNSPRKAVSLLLFPAALVLYRTSRGFDGEFYHTSTDLFFFFIAWIFTLLIARTRATGWRPSDWAIGLGSLGIAWMASLSLGYNFPILGFTGLGLFTIAQIARSPEASPPPLARRSAFYIAGITLGFILALNYYMPFRDKPRPDLTHDLSWLYKKFGPKLMTNITTFRQVQAAQWLADKYTKERPNQPIIVFPEFPSFYWVARRKNPFPLDWWISVDYPGYEEELKEELRKKAPIVLFQLSNNHLHRCKNALYEGDPMTQWILEHSRLLEQLGVYCVLDLSVASAAK